MNDKKTELARVKKVYPITGRRDFFKFVIVEGSIFNKNETICTDFNKKEMYFDDMAHAQRVASARNRVKSKKFLNK